jgi:hypothetical protein
MIVGFLDPKGLTLSEKGRAGMKSATVSGIFLIILGVLVFAYQGVTYTKREKIVDIGPIEATHETRKTIPLPPILGGLALAGGIALVAMGSRRGS